MEQPTGRQWARIGGVGVDGALSINLLTTPQRDTSGSVRELPAGRCPAIVAAVRYSPSYRGPVRGELDRSSSWRRRIRGEPRVSDRLASPE